jgi:hypothetical protein
MKRFFILALTIVFAAFLLTSCKKDKGNPPTLPDVASMSIDFANFQSTAKSAVTDVPKGVNQVNWQYSALMASYWKAVISGTLAVPVAAFKIAVDQTPTYVSDKKWQWSFNVTVGPVTYAARLTGQIGASTVTWNMYISKTGTGSFTDFLWFTGTSANDGTSGQWVLNYSPTFNEPVLQIDWTAASGDVNYVKYTYVRDLNDARATDTFKGSYVEYGTTTGTYDSYYTVHFFYLADWYDANVEWNSSTKIGHVKCLKFFGDSLWHCWDASYVDTTCL